LTASSEAMLRLAWCVYYRGRCSRCVVSWPQRVAVVHFHFWVAVIAAQDLLAASGAVRSTRLAPRERARDTAGGAFRHVTGRYILGDYMIHQLGGVGAACHGIPTGCAAP
jgi:hypothetical protein